MILLLQNTDKRGNMSMQSKVNEAAKRKNCGYNCAQAEIGRASCRERV